MSRALAALVVAHLLVSCGQKPDQVAAYNDGPDFVCAKGFPALVKELEQRPGIIVARFERGLDAYRDDRLADLYLVTHPDHPAHPAIFKRRMNPTSEGIVIVSSACGYGDLNAMRREVAAYSAFDSMLQAEERCWLCSTEKLSPSVHRRMEPPPALEGDRP